MRKEGEGSIKIQTRGMTSQHGIGREGNDVIVPPNKENKADKVPDPSRTKQNKNEAN